MIYKNITERWLIAMENIKKVAVIGCGRISEQYLDNMVNYYKNIEVVGCSDACYENAIKRASQFGIKAMTNEEIFSDKDIDIVVVLVPTPIHAELIRQALNAGKHVYTEKTMTEKLEDGAELIELAKEKGLYLGAAPDTFMGAAYQRARRALDEGLIGTPLSFSLNINRNVEFLASIVEFLRLPGGGLAYDYGVYYFTALVSLLGPVDNLYAVVKNLSKERTNLFPQSPEYGEKYIYDNESQVYAVLNLENGITGTVSMNGDSLVTDVPFFYIYGSKGILKLSCANDFGGDVEYVPAPVGFEIPPAEKLELDSPIVGERRGIGPAEMALSICEGRPNRTSKEMAYHVLDIISTIMESSEKKKMLKVESTCSVPEPITERELLKLV